MLVSPPITNFKMTVRVTVMFLHVALSFSLESSSPDCWEWEESAFRQLSALSLVTSIQVKQTFLSINLAPLMTFEQQASGLHFWLQKQVLNNFQIQFSPQRKPFKQQRLFLYS